MDFNCFLHEGFMSGWLRIWPKVQCLVYAGSSLGFGTEPWCPPPFISLFQPVRQLCLRKQLELSNHPDLRKHVRVVRCLVQSSAETNISFRLCGWSNSAIVEPHRFYSVISHGFILKTASLLHQKSKPIAHLLRLSNFPSRVSHGSLVENLESNCDFRQFFKT